MPNKKSQFKDIEKYAVKGLKQTIPQFMSNRKLTIRIVLKEFVLHSFQTEGICAGGRYRN